MKRLCQALSPILVLILIVAAGGGCSKHARAVRALETGDRYFNEERYDDAEVEYKSARHFDPQNQLAISQLGRIYGKEGRLAEAYQYLKRAAEMQPNSVPVQLAFGQISVTFHETTNAAAIALRILTAQPTNEEALMLLMNSSGNAATAQRQMDSIPNLKANPGFHTAKAALALSQGQTNQTDAELQQALAVNPKSSEAYFILADLRARQGNEKEALAALQKAADLAPWRSNLRMKYVDFLIRNNRGAEAHKALDEITGHAPDYLPGWVGMMNLAMAEKKYDDAAKYADVIISRDERNYEGLLGRGNARLAKGDAAGAVIQLEHLVATFPKMAQAKYELASAYLLAHERAKAIDSLNQAVTIQPGFAQANVLLAQLYIQGGDPAGAISVLTAYMKSAANVAAEAPLLLADAYVSVGQFSEATVVYDDMAKHFPKNAQIPILKGIVLGRQHKDAAARAEFDKSLQLAPNNFPATEQIIDMDLLDHNLTEAATLAQTAIQIHPKAPEPQELMAKVAVAQKDIPLAESSLKKAIELNPNIATPYYSLAQLYNTTGRMDQALESLQSLIKRTNDAGAFMELGVIHEQLKHYDDAAAAYEKVLAIDPESGRALNHLAYVDSVHLNKMDRAYEAAQKARELAPSNPNVADTLGWILFKKGDYASALTLLQESKGKSTADPEIEYHIGMANYMLDKPDNAREALQRAVAGTQDFPGKDEARKRLALLNISPGATGAAVLAQLEEALKDHPDDPIVLARIGIEQERAGQWDKAAATYEASLKQHPNVVPLMARLAWIYTYHLDNSERAQTLAKDAHKLELNNAEVAAVLGHWVYRDRDYSRALGLLESAVGQLSDQPDLLHDLAWSYYSMGRLADAQTTMQKALQIAPGFTASADAKQFVSLTDALGSPAKIQAASVQAKQVLQSDSQYVPALMILGLTQEAAGDFAAAKKTYEDALGIFPSFAPGQRLLAILDSKHFPDDAKGFAAAEKARTVYHDDLDTARSLGILSYYQAKYSRSAELLRESAAANSQDGELYYYLGMDYLQLKQNAESKQNLQKALALNIPEKMAAEAKKALAGAP